MFLQWVQQMNDHTRLYCNEGLGRNKRGWEKQSQKPSKIVVLFLKDSCIAVQYKINLRNETFFLTVLIHSEQDLTTEAWSTPISSTNQILKLKLGPHVILGTRENCLKVTINYSTINVVWASIGRVKIQIEIWKGWCTADTDSKV